MVGIVNGKTKKVPLGEVAGKLKMVSPDDQMVKEAKIDRYQLWRLGVDECHILLYIANFVLTPSQM